MRYLKRFNESKVLDQSVIDECKDILLELEDKGIKTNVSSHFSLGVSKLTHLVNTLQPETLLAMVNDKNWITFYFNRKEEFDYSDIEDVVERLKSYLSEFGLKIDWMSPTERKDNKPTIKTTSVINPMNFQPEGVRTECELHFTSK